MAGVVFAFWAKSDRPAACAALVSPAYLRPDGKVSLHALRLTMDAWAEQDPAAALRWGLDLVDQGLVPVEREEGVRGELFGAWFARDPAGAWQELYERLPDQPQLVGEGLRGMLAEPSGQAALKEWLAPETEPATRAQAIELLQNHLRWSRRNAAFDEVSASLALDETTREEVRRGL